MEATSFELGELNHQVKIMKTSKLEPHREFIISRLQSRTPINQVCKELAKQGCPVSRSYLTEWIVAEGINYIPGKRGRPAETRLFPLLPHSGEAIQINMAHLFFFSLQEGVSENIRIEFRTQSLAALGLPSRSTHPEHWHDLEKYADLSDPELLLMALMRSNLEGPPFAKGGQPMSDWFCKLANLALELRAAIAEAVKRRKS